MISRYKSVYTLSIICFALIISYGQTKIILNRFDEKINWHMNAAKGVAYGYPHWKVYQSRILGPGMVVATQKLTGLNFSRSYRLMMLVWLTIFFAVLTALSFSLFQSGIIAIAIAFSAAFYNAILMQGIWLYPWDYIDLTIFTLFTWAVLTRQSIKVISLIILIEILNREVALIMSGCFLLDGLIRLIRHGTKADLSAVKLQLITSMALIFLTILTIYTLRTTLLIREIGPELFGNINENSGHFQYQLWNNYKEWVTSFKNLGNRTIWYNILIFKILAISIIGGCSRDKEIRTISIFFLILWCSILTFGLIYETRVWLSFVPFLVLVIPKMMISSDRLK